MKDPYLDSFRKNKVASLVKYNIDVLHIRDTILFYPESNTIIEKELWSIKKTMYDSLNFPVKILTSGDVPSNELIRYKRKANKLTQIRIPLNHLRWEYKEDSVDSSKMYAVLFELNDQGEIIRETDTLYKQQIIYEYDDYANLISRSLYYLDDKERRQYWSKYYYQNNSLRKIEFHYLDSLVSVTFFTDGIIDSSTEKSGRYKYILNF